MSQHMVALQFHHGKKGLAIVTVLGEVDVWTQNSKFTAAQHCVASAMGATVALQVGVSTTPIR